ncbi:unnamed protein product [Haemonchus placei]|uniref:DUF3794 domain-containing protein n=1 Tax=Haemonchus placei TaxID=6290 RepID=A0A158QRJ8_HAEPC|nr:unnamed protein product [Haemonchus placei]
MSILPKDEETNRLQFLREFPWYANESCDQVRNLLPVVDCPGSVCIKAVITEPPAKRDVCVQGGAVVRDCWSRVIGEDGPFALDPRALRDVVKVPFQSIFVECPLDSMVQGNFHSSTDVIIRQPKDEETNRLQFLREFPWYANESCDQVRVKLSCQLYNAHDKLSCVGNQKFIVRCRLPGYVCIKAVITEPPAKRDVCGMAYNNSAFCKIVRRLILL